MTAPSVSPDEIAALLAASEIQVQTIFDKVTLVSARLPSGFVLTASSGAVSKENYSEVIGKEVCLRDIENQLWKLEGYHLARSIEPPEPGAVPPSIPTVRPSATPAPTIGRVVHYMLTEDDVKQILLQRGTSTARGGNHNVGDIVALSVTRIWDRDTVNGQIILDGNDCLWVTSIRKQTEGEPYISGRWNWPARN